MDHGQVDWEPIKRWVTRLTLALFVFGGVLWTVLLWQEAAELRAHGVKATARVAAVARVGRHREALLELPGDQQVTIRLSYAAVEGDTMKVTYDPADPTVLDQGWGVNYVGPVLLTLLDAVSVLLSVRYLYSRVTRRPFVPSWLDFGFRGSRFRAPDPVRFDPAKVSKHKVNRRRR